MLMCGRESVHACTFHISLSPENRYLENCTWRVPVLNLHSCHFMLYPIREYQGHPTADWIGVLKNSCLNRVVTFKMLAPYTLVAMAKPWCILSGLRRLSHVKSSAKAYDELQESILAELSGFRGAEEKNIRFIFNDPFNLHRKYF